MAQSSQNQNTNLPIKCQNQGHHNCQITTICLKEDCDKPYRIACSKCINGHHRDHTQYMLKIGDFLSSENQDQLPFQVQNWPITPSGIEIKNYIQEEESYIQDLYEGVDNVFTEFVDKIQKQLEQMKQTVQNDISQFYKKGLGQQKIKFLHQLKSQYIDTYSLEELQTAMKEFINRGIKYEILDTKVEYFCNNHVSKDAQNHIENFYNNNKIDAAFKVDFEQLNSLSLQVTEGLKRMGKITNELTKKEVPKSPGQESISWSDGIHYILNYFSEFQKKVTNQDIIQFKTETYADRSRYEGFLLNGVRDLLGSRFYVDGNVYLGEWKQGVKSGNGIFYYYKGNIYEGGFLNDKKEGFGREMYTNGSRYEGNFLNDVKHGKGRYFYPDGRIFEGTYINDKREGEGIIMYASGKYEEVFYKNGNKVVQNEKGELIEVNSLQISQVKSILK
ncbi:hypothetical protein PPERSA_09297 [Pseudocohnilembus persalinus]|uniref:MORN motif n=1 Tax=Pseudocohnilembus persalinus TaxID=266149 RepID=A0A0V0R567_PSEPJ|nr:hypothetical protein PPERSA_09297 [Pseudocohnilembus persalinus]|eukprot:KRX09627.1 hypothetical protein PPERSA_09297 [Pseudocohnilembus persalinus]